MGVIRPPWIDKELFSKFPFNYCDHFGDIETLATVCNSCKVEMERIEKYRLRGEDPHDMANVMRDVGDNLAKTMLIVAKEAIRMGIDLDNLPEVPEPPSVENNILFKVVTKYGDRIQDAIKQLSEVPIDTDMELAEKTVAALGHSRYYVIVKLKRALDSKWEEEQDSEDELLDSKSSAFLAYIAIERNSRALLALAKHKPLQYLKAEHLKLAKTSIALCEAIQEEFFPDDKLVYEELGYIEY